MRLLILTLCLLLMGCQTDRVPKDIDSVNLDINRYTYQSDEDSRGATDYWKTPSEFYADKGGDCEDYAIAKYHLLKYDHEVAIILGYDKYYKGYHAVLLVDNEYVLDNNSDKVYTLDALRQRMDILFATNDRKQNQCLPSVPESCVTYTLESVRMYLTSP